MKTYGATGRAFDRNGDFSTDFNPPKTEEQKRSLPFMIVSATTFVATLAIIFLITTYSSSRDHTGDLISKASVVSSAGPAKSSKGSSSDGNQINYSLKRKDYSPLAYFDDRYSAPTEYAFLTQYAAIIEPHQDMELHIYDASDDASYYEFKVCPEGENGPALGCQSSSYELKQGKVFKSGLVKFGCTAHSKFTIEVQQIDQTTGRVLAEEIGKGICLYVRREIRSLTDADLQKFLDVQYQYTTLSTEEAKEKYGPSFISHGALLRLHYFNAAQRDQDHYHEGNGFMTHHLQVTNDFEASLQTIDPSVSVPYWDYTIDQKESSSMTDSFVLQSNVYGGIAMPVNPTKGFTYEHDKSIDAAIPDGRWAKIKADKNTQFPDLLYGYGYLRSPWNFNPSPYVSRFGFSFGGGLTLPTCSSHYAALEFTDMMDFIFDIAFGPHGSAHTMISGFYGCEKFGELVDAGIIQNDGSASNACTLWSYIIKDLWRYGYVDVPKSCELKTTDYDKSYCGFTCNEEKKSLIGKYVSARMGPSTINSAAENYYDIMYNFVCNGGSGGAVYTGDHLESASPSDPTFWVIHPTIERLMQAKLMVGGFDNEKWATDPENDYVCEHAACYDETTGETEYKEECCYGHYEHDRVYDGVAGTRDVVVGPSNAEIMAGTDPRLISYSMSYVYDSFTWNHCDEDFGDLLKTLSAEKKLGIKRAKSATQEQAVASRKERLERNRMMYEATKALKAKQHSSS